MPYYSKFVLEHPDLTRHCNVCIVRFYIAHAFDCKKAVLDTSRQSDLHNKVFNLSIKALTPTHMHNDPIIRPCHTVQSRKAFQFGSNLPNNPLGIAVDS